MGNFPKNKIKNAIEAIGIASVIFLIFIGSFFIIITCFIPLVAYGIYVLKEEHRIDTNLKRIQERLKQ